MEKGIIDFEALEKYIIQIEKVMEDSGLNQIEQDLLLKQTHNRLVRKMEELKARDMVSNMPGMSTVMKLLKGKDG